MTFVNLNVNFCAHYLMISLGMLNWY